MKICLIQPKYSTDYERSDYYFEEQLKLMRECNESLDMIVMPESCDIPCLAPTKEAAYASYEKYNKIFLDEVAKMAKKKRTVVTVIIEPPSADVVNKARLAMYQMILKRKGKMNE
jgi:hypothetical protein